MVPNDVHLCELAMHNREAAVHKPGVAAGHLLNSLPDSKYYRSVPTFWITLVYVERAWVVPSCSLPLIGSFRSAPHLVRRMERLLESNLPMLVRTASDVSSESIAGSEEVVLELAFASLTAVSPTGWLCSKQEQCNLHLYLRPRFLSKKVSFNLTQLFLASFLVYICPSTPSLSPPLEALIISSPVSVISTLVKKIELKAVLKEDASWSIQKKFLLDG